MQLLTPLQRNPRAALGLGILLGLLWYGLSGGAGWLFGAPAILVAIFLTLRLTEVRIRTLHGPGLLRYAVFFVRESLLGAFDVAWRACHPRLPLEIHEHWHPLRIPEGQPRSLFVATLSLLPGTLSVDFDGSHVRVHSIAGNPSAALQRLETRVADLFARPGHEESPAE